MRVALAALGGALLTDGMQIGQAVQFGEVLAGGPADIVSNETSVSNLAKWPRIIRRRRRAEPAAEPQAGAETKARAVPPRRIKAEAKAGLHSQNASQGSSHNSSSSSSRKHGLSLDETTLVRGEPSEPGCYVSMYKGCPNHPTNEFGWRHDNWAEEETAAKTNKSACELRQHEWQEYCGTVPMKVLFIAPDHVEWSPLSHADNNQSAAAEPRGSPSEAQPGAGGLESHSEQDISTSPKLELAPELDGDEQGTAGQYERPATATAVDNDRPATPPAVDHELPATMDMAPQHWEKQSNMPGAGESFDDSDVVRGYPSQPGCYYRMPSGCPLHYTKSKMWRHDLAIERRGNVDWATCKARKSHWDSWCSTEDVKVLFVDSVSSASTPHHGDGLAGGADADLEGPTQPGCYVRSPSGCPKHSSKVTAWRRDVWAEQNLGAKRIFAACSDRKTMWDKYCGVTDATMHFVDPRVPQKEPAPQPAPAPGPRPRPTQPLADMGPVDSDPDGGFAQDEEEVSTTGGWLRSLWNGGRKNNNKKADDDGPRDDEAVLAPAVVGGPPKEPGCYVQLPSRCPKHASAKPRSWRHDAWAEEHGGARVQALACEKRKAAWDNWCGASDAKMRFVPEGPADGPAESSLAPYDSAPAEPPRTYGPPRTYEADEHGEEQGMAPLSRDEFFETTPQPQGFVPIQEAIDPEDGPSSVHKYPTTPGCYVRMPSGCPNHPSQKTHWKHDVYAEERHRARERYGKCKDRRSQWNQWCGADDIKMLFIGGDEAAESEEGPNAAWEWQQAVQKPSQQQKAPPRASPSKEQGPGRDGADGEGPDEDVGSPLGVRPKTPAEPGCYVWLPDGCTRQKTFRAQFHWKRDAWGEANMNTGAVSWECSRRKDTYNHWCGTDNAVVVFVPMKPPPMPREPGCYHWHPSGCVKSRTAQTTWRRDVAGEERFGALTSRDACEVRRKAAFDSWCGTADTVMAFVTKNGATMSRSGDGDLAGPAEAPRGGPVAHGDRHRANEDKKPGRQEDARQPLVSGMPEDPEDMFESLESTTPGYRPAPRQHVTGGTSEPKDGTDEDEEDPVSPEDFGGGAAAPPNSPAGAAPGARPRGGSAEEDDDAVSPEDFPDGARASKSFEPPKEPSGPPVPMSSDTGDEDDEILPPEELGGRSYESA